MLKDIVLRVSRAEAGVRLDRFVQQHVQTTDRSLIRSAFEQRSILLNGKPAAKGKTVKEGDAVVIQRLFEKSDRRVAPDPRIPLNIIFEDDALIVFNKPAGMPVHPLEIGETGTLANGMVARFPETADIGPDPLFPALVHRIDTDTSGIVVAARNSEAYDVLRRQFTQHTVKKEYLAVAHGSPPAHGTLTHYLAHDPKRPGFMLFTSAMPAPDARRWMKAVTVYRVLRRWQEAALLEVTIHTGVTHQIRCQLAAIGHPILGDTTYGHAEDRKRWGLDRHLLHAAAITLVHPTTRQRMRFEAPRPEEWQPILTRFR